MHIILNIFIALFLIASVSCWPEPKGLLEMGAIVIDNPRAITKKAFNQLIRYDAILLGELHGTNECAELIYGLAKEFASNDERVLVGFELPHDQLEGIDSGHGNE